MVRILGVPIFRVNTEYLGHNMRKTLKEYVNNERPVGSAFVLSNQELLCPLVEHST